MGPKKFLAIKKEISLIYKNYHKEAYLKIDPLHILIEELGPRDAEILTFIIAGLSYGRVEQILKSYQSLLKCFEKLGCQESGEGIHKYLTNCFSIEESAQALRGWVHRLNTSHDIVGLLAILNSILKSSTSLCDHFQKSYSPDPITQIHAFGEEFRKSSFRDAKNKKWTGTGAAWFAPTPYEGSTCKRLMMWFRWMIREDCVDPGFWQKTLLVNPSLPKPSASNLFYPVDTHIFRWGKKRHIISGASMNWKSVCEITNFFKLISPDDPVKFDFSLCTAGKLNFRKVVPTQSRALSRHSPQL